MLDRNTQPDILTEPDIRKLPALVKAYIRKSGAMGEPKVTSFCVEMAGSMQKKEDNVQMPFISIQHNFMRTATRLFFMDAVMKHLPVAVYHCFKNGVASMDVRVMSMLRVQYVVGKTMNDSETVTFFNDMCCLAPATLIDPRVTWSEVETDSVRATFTNMGITISAHLYFNNNDELVNFVSDDRSALLEDGSFQKLRWSTPLSQYDDRLGNHLPRHAKAVYTYADGPFAYGLFEVTRVTYNGL